MQTKQFDDLYLFTKKPQFVFEMEQIVYFFARKLSGKEYQSGFWESKTVSIDSDKTFWLFELQGDETWTLSSENVREGEKISTKLLSLLAFAFAINYTLSVIFQDPHCSALSEELSSLYYLVRDNVNLILDERETSLFYRVID